MNGAEEAVRSVWRWAWVVMILVWPIFAHGCHSGDHDDELSVIPDPLHTTNNTLTE